MTILSRDVFPDFPIKIHTLEHRHMHRRQRELRTLIAEAERRGDNGMLATLIHERLQLDRQLREH